MMGSGGEASRSVERPCRFKPASELVSTIVPTGTIRLARSGKFVCVASRACGRLRHGPALGRPRLKAASRSTALTTFSIARLSLRSVRRAICDRSCSASSSSQRSPAGSRCRSPAGQRPGAHRGARPSASKPPGRSAPAAPQSPFRAAISASGLRLWPLNTDHVPPSRMEQPPSRRDPQSPHLLRTRSHQGGSRDSLSAFGPSPGRDLPHQGPVWASVGSCSISKTRIAQLRPRQTLSVA
jgi:hypothetical protein